MLEVSLGEKAKSFLFMLLLQNSHQPNNIHVHFVDGPVPHAFSALQVEAEAWRAGLLKVIHQEWSNVDLESDGSLLVSALTHNSLDFGWFYYRSNCSGL